jgi:thiol-disulfide isomerase/thioredoxin
MFGKVLKITLWIFVIVIVTYALYMTYRDVSFNLKSNTKAETESFEDAKVKIYLVYALWCPHCEKYIDSNIFMSTYEELNKQQKYNSVVFEQIDYDKNTKLVDKYDINGFPSIIAIDSNGKLLGNFTGNRFNKNELIKFVDTNLSKV